MQDRPHPPTPPEAPTAQRRRTTAPRSGSELVRRLRVGRRARAPPRRREHPRRLDPGHRRHGHAPADAAARRSTIPSSSGCSRRPSRPCSSRSPACAIWSSSCIRRASSRRASRSRWRSRSTRPSATPAVEYRLDDQFASQPAMPQSAILFRIAQEALANVREHARASSVTVTLLERDGGHAVRIADDGCGFETALEPPEAEGVRVREHACARAPRRRQPARRVRPRRRHDGRGLAAAPADPGATAGRHERASAIRVLIAEEDADARAALATPRDARADARARRCRRRRRAGDSRLDAREAGRRRARRAHPGRRRDRRARHQALLAARRACSRCRRQTTARQCLRCSRPAPTAIS